MNIEHQAITIDKTKNVTQMNKSIEIQNAHEQRWSHLHGLCSLESINKPIMSQVKYSLIA